MGSSTSASTLPVPSWPGVFGMSDLAAFMFSGDRDLAAGRDQRLDMTPQYEASGRSPDGLLTKRSGRRRINNRGI